MTESMSLSSKKNSFYYEKIISDFWSIIRDGNISRARKFLNQRNININTTNTDNETFLMYSIGWGRKIEITKLLLKRNDIDVNKQNYTGNTALMYALKTYSIKIVKLLLDRSDVDIDIRNNRDKSPLSFVLKSKCIDLIKLMINRCERIDVDDHKASHTLLELKLKKLEETRKEFERMYENSRFYFVWNKKETYSSEALIESVRGKDYFEEIKYLLDQYYIDINLKNEEGKSAFIISVEIMLERYSMKKNSYFSPYMKIFQLLFNDDNLNINIRDKKGNTALMLVIKQLNLNMFNMLLSRDDINVNTINEYGESPLSILLEFHLTDKIILPIKTLLKRDDIIVTDRIIFLAKQHNIPEINKLIELNKQIKFQTIFQTERK